MQYATLGKTGYRVSRLGFGAMRLPMAGGVVDTAKAVALLHHAFDLGINFVDCAVFYCNNDSQRAMGAALAGWRDRIIVSTKNHYYNKADDRPWWKNLEYSLRLLGTDHIDLYNFHGMSRSKWNDHVSGKGGQLEWMHKARSQGMIRHIGCSFHDKPDALVELAQTGEFESVILQYNLIDRSNEPALDACRKANMGVVVMGPVGGGRLGAPSPALMKLVSGAASVPEVALRFVLANPNVTAAISGMETMQHVDENARTASHARALSPAQKRRIVEILNQYHKLSDLYCTGCNYCMPCPAGVRIPDNFLAQNYFKVYGLEKLARDRYAAMAGKASGCIACGACMNKCPQHLDIVEQLRQTVRTLDQAYGHTVLTLRPKRAGALRVARGRHALQLGVELECRNLSDAPLSAALALKPAAAIALPSQPKLKKLDAFGRQVIGLSLNVSGLRDGQELSLSPKIQGATGVMVANDPLAVAVAAPVSGGRREAALKLAPAVAARIVGGVAKPTAAAGRRHGLTARFAYDADGLLCRFKVAGPFSRPATKSASLRSHDHIWLNIDTRMAQGLQREGGGDSFIILLGAPRAGSTEIPAEVFRPFLPPDAAKGIQTRARRNGELWRIDVRVPWSLVKLSAPRAGAQLGVNVGKSRQVPKGAWILLWREESTPVLILAE